MASANYIPGPFFLDQQNFKSKEILNPKTICPKKLMLKQAVAELGQTQVIDEIVVEVRSGNCRWSLSSTTCPGGWWVVGGRIKRN